MATLYLGDSKIEGWIVLPLTLPGDVGRIKANLPTHELRIN